MKKTFLIALVVVMCLTFAACGADKGNEKETNTSAPTESSVADNPTETSTESSATDNPTEASAEPVVLADVVITGVAMKLPSGMIALEDYLYGDTVTGDSATVMADMGDESWPLSEVTQDDFVGYQLSHLANLVVSSYDNNVVLNGNKSIICKFSFTSEEGNAINGTIVVVSYNGAEYSISLLYSSDNTESPLSRSMDEVINSIAPVAY